ncbi:uncharacterized protein LOC136088797 isoform X2 [Hydra vulgaris]|uniref:Uncharacterized protein LOC136088797 isoform X2 n=1 Tax=Hydra vulgaris TaxID=6087 RepID=A0ABM4D5R3_HYDVU
MSNSVVVHIDYIIKFQLLQNQREMSSKGLMFFFTFLCTIDSIKTVIGFIVCAGIISFVCGICNVFRYSVHYSCTNDSADFAFICVVLGTIYHIFKIFKGDSPPPPKSMWDTFFEKPTQAKKQSNGFISIVFNGALVVGITLCIIRCYVCDDPLIYNWLLEKISDFEKQLTGMLSNQTYVR